MLKRRSAKAKGMSFQRWVRDELIDFFNLSKESHKIKSTSSGVKGVDIQFDEDLRWPFATEVKRVEKLNVDEAFRQAEANTTGELFPLLIYKKNRQEPKAVIKFKDLLTILKGGR